MYRGRVLLMNFALGRVVLVRAWKESRCVGKVYVTHTASTVEEVGDRCRRRADALSSARDVMPRFELCVIGRDALGNIIWPRTRLLPDVAFTMLVPLEGHTIPHCRWVF